MARISKYAVEPPYADMRDEDLYKFARNQMKYMSALLKSFQVVAKTGDKKNPGLKEYAKVAIESYDIIKAKGVPSIKASTPEDERKRNRQKIIAQIKRNTAFVSTYGTAKSKQAKKTAKEASDIHNALKKLGIRSSIQKLIMENKGGKDFLMSKVKDTNALYNMSIISKKHENKFSGESETFLFFAFLLDRLWKFGYYNATDELEDIIEHNDDMDAMMRSVAAKYPNFYNQLGEHEKGKKGKYKAKEAGRLKMTSDLLKSYGVKI